ncbi:hypothetical protein [Polaromonas sp. SM01]|uniref:hypothetical protein n=1 Tax=Polaromonas sp. SM01 TaxID=3085630 RepID=UPI002980B9B0|nr:hypothetical protein [Polaromonas sp. SM01]MDW5441814.1 hypothetical protein [Polaromonas sp. SM01]
MLVTENMLGDIISDFIAAQAMTVQWQREKSGKHRLIDGSRAIEGTVEKVSASGSRVFS